MYDVSMKTRKTQQKSLELKEAIMPYGEEISGSEMVRTQIYLTRAEHKFLHNEAGRRGEPMSAVIRGIIDEKMDLPDEVWTNNPLLEPTPYDPDFEGREDGSLNHDHYVYGGPKKYHKVRGKWVPVDPDEM